MGRSCINLVGNTTQGQNLGTGTTIFAGKVGSNTLSYKSLSALGSGISITCDNNNIYFSGSTGGTSYTFNNGLTETSGTVKLGGSLCEYTNLTVGSNGITIADDDFDVYFDLNDFGYNLHHYNTNISSGGDSTYSCIQITAQPSGGTSGNLITIGSSGDVMWYNNCFIVRASSTAPNYPGIQYLTSYMADYTDRSLPDWEAVKCLVESGGTGGTSYTFNNGLIEQGDVVSLGGTLTGVTTINLDNNAFCFNLNPSTNSNVRFGDGGDTIIGEFNNPVVHILQYFLQIVIYHFYL